MQSLLLARAATSVAPSTARDWLLLGDAGDVASALAARLRGRGDRCTLVRPGDAYSMGGDVAVIRPTVAADHRRVLADLRAAGRRIHGALHAWSLDVTAWDRMTPAELSLAQSQGAVSATLLAQALVAENPTPRLWLASRGGQQADAADASLDPAQAPAWGLAKALALEHPELHCVCVDLGPRGASRRDRCAAGRAGRARRRNAGGLARRVARRVARLGRVRRAHEGRRVAARATVRGSFPRPAARSIASICEPMVRRAPGPGEVEIAVEATGLNFKDVLNVLGMYPGDPGRSAASAPAASTAVGAGVTHVRPGDAVLAAAGGSFASHVIARAELVQPRPAGMSAEEAASFPIAFLTAEFCLGHLAQADARASAC